MVEIMINTCWPHGEKILAAKNVNIYLTPSLDGYWLILFSNRNFADREKHKKFVMDNAPIKALRKTLIARRALYGLSIKNIDAIIKALKSAKAFKNYEDIKIWK